jgi:hypothetical protein
MSNMYSYKSNGSSGITAGVTIREADDADAVGLRRLAQRDSASVPAAPLLVAELGGELHAAVSLEDGTTVADPFRPTAGLVSLLHARAAQLRLGRSKPLRLIARTAASTPRALGHAA